ncbi:MAG: UTRA domain-containing protein [Atopobiaceae bacterium]|nr:UTRA domain-containing protein [Atopobiaceae bacterium]MBR1829388.1 UTRA domain-containing protein [Atopobiaceae bacterium]
MKAIYYDIYKDLREKIMSGVYPYQTYIPSELKLIEEYECTHNTLRKALQVLQMHGFVQPIRGKGVLVIWQLGRRTRFVLGDIENMREAGERNGLVIETSVRRFERIVADERVAQLTGFAAGDELIRVERVRRLDGANLIFDKSCFLASSVEGLTPEIAADSIFTYLEGTLGMQITTSNRTITMEYATAEDREVLDLLDFDMLAVMENRTFNSDGVHFETTQSRHRPDYFSFLTTAVRGY